ncbi:group II intron reverse transcriptase/maturase [Echinicola vietnamensis]|uniref:group II intron reverse transcriptase/maturase n=1 Tax=Echinicola vietnamensis TaxID=390884 RepID=UPI0002F2CB3A|nr:group II intron reverse transcriptase/maturase [Echinicola vietnamensis]
MELLTSSYRQLNKTSSVGVDGESWNAYGLRLPDRLPELLRTVKSGEYKAPQIRRVYIPKGKTGKRPLGIPTIEDKVLQPSVRSVLEPIYEEDFKEFSYGFRPNRSCHHAIEYMFEKVSYGRMRYIIDADIQDYFGSIDHGLLRVFLDRRVKDGVVRKMLDKWLKAGILEDKQLHYPKGGTPQGGIVSPILSNIYLHYVLDEWFSDKIQPLLTGKSFMVRYADDFVMGFEKGEDAKRVMAVLDKRFTKYGLRLHPEKTKVIDLNTNIRGERSFDFLGFAHYMGKTRKGRLVLKRKTSSKKLVMAITKTGDWIKGNRHRKLKELICDLNVRLRGHYAYYGVTFNVRSLNKYHRCVERLLHKWLNRRGGNEPLYLEKIV